MLEAIVSSLLLASITGLTYLAHKHPPGYRALVVRALGPAVVGLGLALTGMFAADIYTNAHTGLAIAKEFPALTVASMAERLTEIRDKSGYILSGLCITVVAAAYLTFLWLLPVLTGKSRSGPA